MPDIISGFGLKYNDRDWYTDASKTPQVMEQGFWGDIRAFFGMKFMPLANLQSLTYVVDIKTRAT